MGNLIKLEFSSSKSFKIILFYICIYFDTKIHGYYRATGASLSKAQAEFTTNVLSNEGVRSVLHPVFIRLGLDNFSQERRCTGSSCRSEAGFPRWSPGTGTVTLDYQAHLIVKFGRCCLKQKITSQSSWL